MLDRETKAFDFAQDAVKQLITIATAIITFTIGFLKDIAANAPQYARDALTIAWILYFLSICAGALTLLNLTGELHTSASPTIYRGSIRLLAIAQVLLFAAALAVTLYFGANANSKA